MKSYTIIVIALIVSFTTVNNSYSQTTAIVQQSYNTSMLHVVTINNEDKTTYVGYIIDRTTKDITLLTDAQTKIQIPIESILSITEVSKDQYRNGEYWFPNPNETRYLFAPSALNLKKGEGYYQNTYLFLNSFNYGIDDNFSIGAGLEFLSTFNALGDGEFDPIFFITPKVNTKVSDNVHLGLGLLYGNIPGLFGGFGIGYGLATYGNPEHNTTLGLGFGYIDGRFSGDPVITLSGMTRISRRISLVTENWFFPSDVYRGIVTYGIRFFGEQMSVDLALLNNADLVEVFPVGIPYVDFVVKF